VLSTASRVADYAVVCNARSKLFNKPNGPDVYAGLPKVRLVSQCRDNAAKTCTCLSAERKFQECICRQFSTSQDYTGDAVTAENFLAVLRGEEVRRSCA